MYRMAMKFSKTFIGLLHMYIFIAWIGGSVLCVNIITYGLPLWTTVPEFEVCLLLVKVTLGVAINTKCLAI